MKEIYRITNWSITYDETFRKFYVYNKGNVKFTYIIGEYVHDERGKTCPKRYMPKSVIMAIDRFLGHTPERVSTYQLTNRTYGIEIETMVPNKQELARKLSQAGVPNNIEGYNHNDSTVNWKLTTDSSIDACERYVSVEIVSPILRGEEGLDQIRKVCRVLAEVNAKVNKSCGMHVHHDARDFGRREFINLLENYRVNESNWDAIVSASRRGNNNDYCRSLGDVAIDRPDFFATRYMKLNYKAYLRHGTIEFRQHQGTVEAIKIINWIKLTQSFLEYSINRTPRRMLFNEFITNLKGDLAWWTQRKAVLA